jgi:hypothetical protein
LDGRDDGTEFDDGNWSNEPIAATVHGFDEGWLVGIISESLTDLADGLFQGRRRQVFLAPNQIKQLIVGEDFGCVFDQDFEQAEGLMTKFVLTVRPQESAAFQIQGE